MSAAIDTALPILAMQPDDVRIGRPRLMSLGRVLALSGGPFPNPGWPAKNLHTDMAAAQAAGLATIVVSGTQWEGHMVGLLVDTVGPGWFAGGTIDIKLPRSVKVDETLTPQLKLEGFEERAGRRFALFSVTVLNGDGQEVLVGSASAPVPAGAA